MKQPIPKSSGLCFFFLVINIVLLPASTNVHKRYKNTPRFNVQMLYSTIVLPMGTPVSLALNQEINASQVEVGQTVDLIVIQDVVIKGHTAIRTGLRGEGRIKEVIKPCLGYCGFHQSKLVIAITTVQAVDGQKVYLTGPELMIKGDGHHHTPAVAKQRQLITGYVRAATQINDQ